MLSYCGFFKQGGTPRQVVGAYQDVGSEAPPFPLTREEQLAIIEYCQRAALLTPERAIEVAAAAGPFIAGLGGEAAQVALQLPAAITGLFQGMLLFFLLGADVFVDYRLKPRPRPAYA